MARSRITQKKQQQMVRQTIMVIVITMVILVAFIFVIMPRFILLADKIFNSEVISENGDHVPPQAPILAAPISATNSATLPISGVGEAESKVILVLNGVQSDETQADQEGEFKIEVPLTEGENALAVYGVDEAGNESVQTREYRVILDTTAPEIEIETPTDGSSVELRKNQVITVKGKTEPRAKVFINDRLVYAKEEGDFVMNYQLEEGENTLKFKVEDQGGNVSQKEIKVSFRY
jgi:hypothetical protein